MNLRFLARRALLAIATLAVLSVLVFLCCQVLPGNIGLTILGPDADPGAVAELNRKFGIDRPIVEQYSTWIANFLRGDMGQSYVFRSPVAPFVLDGLGNSLKLAGVALLLVIPLGILGGVLAALHVNRPLDRAITLGGLAATVLPEFVTGIVLILIFGVWLDWLPISATWPEGTGPLNQVYYLLAPALTLVLALFGYISRMTRAGMVEALDSDYTRTAVLKGLPWRTVISRHVLRNALLPTITVIATQAGHLIGGLVVVETLFRYHGIGSVIFQAASGKDIQMLEAGVMVIGIAFALTTLAADLLYAVLNPRIRMGGSQ